MAETCAYYKGQTSICLRPPHDPGVPYCTKHRMWILQRRDAEGLTWDYERD